MNADPVYFSTALQIDVSNESHGIKVGMAASGHLTGAGTDTARQQNGCC
jgi:hypothetical protein